MKITIKDKLKIFTGGSWHYVLTSEEQYKKIKAEYKGFKSRGFGSIPCKVELGKSEWITSIFPMKQKQYILFIKKEIRNKEKLTLGDDVIANIEI